jgi:hypothetical protein
MDFTLRSFSRGLLVKYFSKKNKNPDGSISHLTINHTHHIPADSGTDMRTWASMTMMHVMM